ncbi:MAG: hypothetical protein GY822_23290 [Deltaproteobacteria bacterium]|nr:hypothetical protein [Deltaproteobacteria bacterium]
MEMKLLKFGFGVLVGAAAVIGGRALLGASVIDEKPWGSGRSRPSVADMEGPELKEVAG